MLVRMLILKIVGPLADAIHYKNHDMIKLLEKHGAKPLMAPMHVKNAHEVPEYEIDAKELDFTDSGTFTIASWRGTKVAVKKLGDELFTDKEKVRAFRDELELLQKIRHPNVVQFLGAVTQSSPMMIVTEYLPKGDLRLFLKRKGALKPITALKFGMDIARGMNYLHENKPEPIIHRDLEPSNVLRADSGHLKVTDFGISELLKVANKTAKQEKLLSYHDTTCTLHNSMLLLDAFNKDRASLPSPLPNPPSLAPLPVPTPDARTQELINEKLKKAEDLGEQGMLDEAQKALEEAEALKKTDQKLRVCDICGAFLSVYDRWCFHQRKKLRISSRSVIRSKRIRVGR
ncbi:putative protein kinase TKL-Pl-5 family [Helianthus debilis subsp. tardiflorus]